MRGGAEPALRGCDFLQLQLCCFIQTFLSLCHSDAELVKRKGLSICLPRQCLIGRQFRVGGVAKCRQARMKIARHGAAAECRVGKRDDLSPALAGRLNRSLQKRSQPLSAASGSCLPQQSSKARSEEPRRFSLCHAVSGSEVVTFLHE